MIFDDFEGKARGKNRLTDAMSRVGVDLTAVYDPRNGKAWIEAAHSCKRCSSADRCDRWLESSEDGDGVDAPEFCPNAELLQRFKAERE